MSDETNKSEATDGGGPALPWKAEKIGVGGSDIPVYDIFDAHGKRVATVAGDAAALICRAVNNHADLVEALEKAMHRLAQYDPVGADESLWFDASGKPNTVLGECRATLAKAKA